MRMIFIREPLIGERQRAFAISAVRVALAVACVVIGIVIGWRVGDRVVAVGGLAVFIALANGYSKSYSP